MTRRTATRRRAYSRRRHSIHEAAARACSWCGARLDLQNHRRRDVRYCNDACRQAASRARRGIPHGWGDATDRKARRAAAASVVPVTGQP